MLESILPWVYLWPAVFVGILSLLLLAVALNTVLFALLFGFYYMLPHELIDDWILSGVEMVRTKFRYYFDRVEHHLKQTFPVYNLEYLPATSLLLWHPHSLMCVTAVLHNTFKLSDLGTKLATHSIFHWIPIVKDVVRAGSAIPAGYTEIKDTLVGGQSVIIIPGGTREIIEDPKPNVIRAGITRRKGVFRIALETGTPLTPVLSYGENELFPSIHNPLNEFLYKWFKIAIPLTSWTAVSNWLKLWNGPITQIPTYIGKPVQVDKKDSPTDEDIDALKTRYREALQTLFDETAPKGYLLAFE